jgi:hypothetical protein
MRIASSDVIDISFLPNEIMQLIVRRRAWRHVINRLADAKVAIACLAPSDPQQLTMDEWSSCTAQELPALAAEVFANRVDEAISRVTDDKFATLLKERAARSRAYAAQRRAETTAPADTADDASGTDSPVSSVESPDQGSSTSNPIADLPEAGQIDSWADDVEAAEESEAATAEEEQPAPTARNPLKRARLPNPLIAPALLSTEAEDTPMSTDNVSGADSAHRSQ